MLKSIEMKVKLVENNTEYVQSDEIQFRSVSVCVCVFFSFFFNGTNNTRTRLHDVTHYIKPKKKKRRRRRAGGSSVQTYAICS